MIALQDWIDKKLTSQLSAGVAAGTDANMAEYEVCRTEIAGLASQTNETLEASLAELVQSIGV